MEPMRRVKASLPLSRIRSLSLSPLSRLLLPAMQVLSPKPKTPKP